MQYTQGQLGRIFALRLEHGDPMPKTLEDFCCEQGIESGMAIMVGGADDGGRLVVGPEDGNAMPAVPMVATLSGVHEVAAVGLVFAGPEGRPALHMHAAYSLTVLNRKARPGVGTMSLMSSPQYSSLSSGGVKGIASLGGAVDDLVPLPVAKRFREIFPAGQGGAPVSPQE